jgi:hypothetical protein
MEGRKKKQYKSKREIRNTLKNTVCQDVMPHSLVMIQMSSGTVCYLFLAGCLLGLFTAPEDGGSMFLQNASKLLSDYSTLQSHCQFQETYCLHNREQEYMQAANTVCHRLSKTYNAKQ